MTEVLERLQTWYSQQCNGEWEHDSGIQIGTLDNPGWTVDIDLSGTNLENAQLEKSKTERSPQDWLVVWTENTKFKARGGPYNLTEILETFLNWAKRIQ
ncbi:MAG TPA: immunity 53 family protein [Verrucomicrobiae bacterium]|nr:immunity 53 family protein [Verrucomicrobiae bacterium]